MIVSILGCGWIGKALRDTLKKRDIKVNCLSKNIKENISKNFYRCDTLVIALPPSINNYLNILEQNFKHLNKNNIPQVVFLSSISFYRGKSIVVMAEKLILKLHKDSVILRLGGLMGYDRIAGKYTTNKKIINGYTNYIHKDDVVAIIYKIIELKLNNCIYDLVAPIQTTKEKIYNQNAIQFGFAKSIFEKRFESKLNLTPKKLCEDLNYKFIKPCVLEFWS